MQNTNVSAPHGPPIPPRGIIDALVRLIRNEFPTLAVGMVLTEQILKQIYNKVKENIMALVGSAFTTAGIAALLPSLCVVVVNAMGFTQGGVAAGSLAAALQSAFWGANTGGVFSVFQAFGATAVVASPAVLIAGGICVGVGMGFLKKYYGRGGCSSSSPGDDHDIDPTGSEPRYLIDPDGSSNAPRAAVLRKARKPSDFFDFFRGKEKFD